MFPVLVHGRESVCAYEWRSQAQRTGVAHKIRSAETLGQDGGLRGSTGASRPRGTPAQWVSLNHTNCKRAHKTQLSSWCICQARTRIWKGCHRSRWHSTTQLHSQACSSFGQSNKIQAKDSIRDPWDQERRAGTASCTSGKQHVKLCLLKANCHWNRPYTGIARKLDLTFCRLQISIYPEDSLNKLAYSWMKLTSSTKEYQNKCFLFSWKYHHFGCARRLAPQNTLPSAWSAFVTADFHFIHLLSAHTPSVLCRGDAERKRRERQRVRQIESDTFFHIALAATASWSG